MEPCLTNEHGVQHKEALMSRAGWLLWLCQFYLLYRGGVYWGYDTLNRFYGVEGGVSEALGNTSANAKQISELQKSLTKLSTDTERERTANKTFAATQLTTASQAITKEVQEAETDLSNEITELEADVTSRIQTVEQAIIDNDVRGLNSKLAQLATNMQQILEQQKVLLDLRSQG